MSHHKQIVVLGAGMVGRAIAADLATDYAVTAVDANPAAVDAFVAECGLAGRVADARVADLRDAAAIRVAIADADLVIGAVPGHLGFATLKTVIESGKDVVDISFFDEDPFALDELARQERVTAVMDCGVAPGLSNILLGYHAATMTVESFRCLVGGLPVSRDWPWQYKAPFSPIDVLEEYTRPARLMEGGQVVIRPALSELETVEIADVGTLEAFNTDGLRTLLRTVNAPNMAEKTLRYPGHIEYIRVLAESGMFDKSPIQVSGASVRPIDVTAALLFPQWKLMPGEPEFTVMDVTVTGHVDGTPVTHAYHLYDCTDEATGASSMAPPSSMARTTGYTCTAVARLVLAGAWDRKGICPPEYVGADPACFERILAHLAARGVRVEKVQV